MFWNRAEIAMCKVETLSQSQVIALLVFTCLLDPYTSSIPMEYL